MLLQTLLENAVKHGIGSTINGGEVMIRAAKNHGSVHLEVENTGHLSGDSSNPSGLGLANARERLRLLYNGQASLSLRNGDGGVTASAIIPGI